jgi:hypothetical protein
MKTEKLELDREEYDYSFPKEKEVESKKFIPYNGWLPPKVFTALNKYLADKYGNYKGQRSSYIADLIIKALKKEKYL